MFARLVLICASLVSSHLVESAHNPRAQEKFLQGRAGPPHAGNARGSHQGESSHKNNKDSICNKYTASILGANTPENQQLLMTLFVNTALVGNYTTPNVGVAVNGIIWPGQWKGKSVDLMPWFNGELNSSNPCADDCGHGVPVNWLDAGGPDALRQNLTSFWQDSNQFFFVTHLHQYFGYLLDCGDFGTSFQRYNGSTNMYHIHKYMAISNAQEQYTNEQFYLSAKSLGFSEADSRRIWKQLFWLFSQRCEPPKSIPKWAEPAPQSICINYDCPLPKHAVCELYEPVVEPVPVNDTGVEYST